MNSYAIQGTMIGRADTAGPQGSGVAEDICFTLTKADVHAVCTTGGGAAMIDQSTPAPASNYNHPGLRFLSVCSGIEAASVAWGSLGWEAAAFAEIEKFPAAVLAHHYPHVPNLGDMTKIDTAALGRVDILCGGTPCQAFSVAGARGGLGDARGNLSLEFVRLAHELAQGNGLRNAVWENVPGALTMSDNFFGCFLGGLVGADAPLRTPDGGSWPNAGMVAGPLGRAAWRVLDAQYFGLAQRRKRVLVVADFGNGADPAAVLFERKGLRGHPPARGEAGEDVAPTISARTKGGGGLGTDFDLDGGLVQYAPEIARCVATREGSSQDYESTTMVAQAQCVTGEPSHALTAEGHDASEDGTGRGTPIVCFQSKASATNSMNPGDISPTMDKGKSDGLATFAGAAVRRLTPRECERLQGFQWLCAPTDKGAWQDSAGRWWSPDYTDIPWRGKPCAPDGPRYKALGNSWAVPKFTWLGRRIAAHMPPANDNAAMPRRA